MILVSSLASFMHVLASVPSEQIYLIFFVQQEPEPEPETEPRARIRFRFFLGQNDTVPAVPVPQHCMRQDVFGASEIFSNQEHTRWFQLYFGFFSGPPTLTKNHCLSANFVCVLFLDFSQNINSATEEFRYISLQLISITPQYVTYTLNLKVVFRSCSGLSGESSIPDFIKPKEELRRVEKEIT